MSDSRDDWDAAEREALTPLRAEVDAARARHRDDVPLEVLQASLAGALGDEAQEAARARVARDGWSRALMEGIDPAPLDAIAQARILGDVRRRRSSSRLMWLGPAAGLAAAAVVAAMVFLPRQPAPVPEATTSEASPVEGALLTIPEFRLSANALITRGPGGSGSLVDDLGPAVTAYRANDFATAAAHLSRLQSKYPSSVEVTLYLGVSRLVSGEAQAAITALRQAKALGATEFSADIDWYLATALGRAGDRAEARRLFESLCGGTSPHAAAACGAAAAIR